MSTDGAVYKHRSCNTVSLSWSSSSSSTLATAAALTAATAAKVLLLLGVLRLRLVLLFHSIL